ncbi:hypothetical protein Tsubulata_020958 [Turnera subulata]|uniref:Uncharacterized protein n=1 Tax=Turnera subulata TaxID=218843 RepID=A0A9Q0GJS6_9ROSI|nr:hypothetical protein Tsubulata_020958 [Turnera subulata]
MPQVDLETLVSACAGASCDRKIACETIAAAIATDRPEDSDTDPPEVPPDFPPESFWLSKDAEFDWFDRNAFIERKDSTKGNSANLNPLLHPNSSSTSSQRFSANLKSKPSIFSLPKPQKSCFVDPKNRRPCTRLFPRRASSSGKSDPALVEPSSPKVSCMGRVRSKRDRNRRLKNRHRAPAPKDAVVVKAEKPKSSRKDGPLGRRNRTGFLSSFRAMFRSGKKNEDVDAASASASTGGGGSRKVVAEVVRSNDIRDRLPARDRDALARRSGSVKLAEPPAAGLGGMMRLSSGRRSDAFGVGADVA